MFCPSSTQPGVKFGDIFYLEHPEIDLSSRNIRKFQDMIFMMYLVKENNQTSEESSLSLRGQILRIPKNNLFLFLGSPRVTSFSDLQEKGMHFSDIAAHDVTRDLILFNQQRIAEVELTRQLEQKQEELRTLMRELEIEKAKTDSLLYSMLPKQVANLLREGKTVHAGEYNEVTILFSDVVKFTDICSRCKPLQIVHLLNEMYTKFDKLTTVHDVYKVETIGDAYMVVGGIPVPTELHATNICKFALDQIEAVADVKTPNCSDESIKIRVGIHSGPVVAGVVGLKMPRYCLFGDTVNTASRMESHGVQGRIHLSENVLR
ncbi:Guanylate cyclase soluble subunit beta-2 [Holothuria leucospilota]|uniref:guanylate cyclase n=1 Tax=Holothuria leucospilota TaxID=206669 RepID=A0A9Q1BXZ0_HOLLE|nr:Guanylate cyclase soluble subunit beta-2 [Holothuria leucospilota]